MKIYVFLKDIKFLYTGLFPTIKSYFNIAF